MKLMILIACVFLQAVSVSTGAMLTERQLQELGMVITDGENQQSYRIIGDNAKRCQQVVVPVDGQPFTSAVQIDNGGPSVHPYDVQLLLPAQQPIKRGDVLLVRFYCRVLKGATETGEIRTEFLFQHIVPPAFPVQYRQLIGPTARWEQFSFRFVAKEDMPVNEGAAVVRLGYEGAVVQFGAMQVLNFGTAVDVKDLPETRPTYIGREPDAAWREDAQDRTEKIRKADVTIKVVDTDGNPVTNAAVRVRLKKHAFGFGNIINDYYFVGASANTPDGERYRTLFLQMFNKGVVSHMTWRWWENRGLYEKQLQGIEWFHANGITDLHGSHLMWAKWMRIPTSTNQSTGEYKGIKWAETTENDNDNNASLGEYQAHVQADGDAVAKEWLRARVRSHVTAKATAMKGVIKSWNVVNEHYDEHVLTDIFGMDEMVEWFKLARAADPKARLMLNDANVIGADRKHEDAYYDLIRFLLDRGAPLDAIGEESHFGYKLPPPTQVLRILDRFAAFGKPIEITEFDVDTPDEQLQADYVRDYLTVAFSHPSVEAITQWGLWQGDHWRANGGLWRKDWSVKPAGRVLQDLLTRQWQTDVSGSTDTEGKFHSRGFLGDYSVQVSRGDGVAVIRQATLAAGSATWVVEVK
jgi:endo-1,4-beta-xylanase